MSLTSNQKIFLAVIFLLIIILGLGLLGIIPGIKKETDPNKNLKFTLNVWVFDENVKAYETILNYFREKYPKGEIRIKNFVDKKEYKNNVLNALAEGSGPDIFMIENGTLQENLNKLYPVSSNIFNVDKLKKNFPNIVYQDVVFDNKIYGLPIYIDNLALIYNRDIFDENFILTPSFETWDEFLNNLSLLKKGVDQKIKGVALGGSLKSISNAVDILNLIILQKNGIKEENKNFSLNREKIIESFSFYTQFSNLNSNYYTWDNSLNSIQEFRKENIAMFFGYYRDYVYFKKYLNNLAVVAVPQFNLNRKIAIPNYWFFVVSKQSKFKNLAWEFIIEITNNQNLIYDYLNNSKNRLPINRQILENIFRKDDFDSDIKIFLSQVPYLKSLQYKNKKYFYQSINEILENILEKRIKISEVFENLYLKLNYD